MRELSYEENSGEGKYKVGEKILLVVVIMTMMMMMMIMILMMRINDDDDNDDVDDRGLLKFFLASSTDWLLLDLQVWPPFYQYRHLMTT